LQSLEQSISNLSEVIGNIGNSLDVKFTALFTQTEEMRKKNMEDFEHPSWDLSTQTYRKRLPTSVKVLIRRPTHSPNRRSFALGFDSNDPTHNIVRAILDNLDQESAKGVDHCQLSSKKMFTMKWVSSKSWMAQLRAGRGRGLQRDMVLTSKRFVCSFYVYFLVLNSWEVDVHDEVVFIQELDGTVTLVMDCRETWVSHPSVLQFLC